MNQFTDLTPVNYIFGLIDILVVWYVIYKLLGLIQGTKAVQLLKGIFVIVIAKIATALFGLSTLDYLLKQVIEWGFLAIIIIFQPEIRRALEQLGRGKIFQRSTNQQDEEQTRLVEAMKKSVSYMAKRRIGALISIEKETGLTEYIETGTALNATVSSELLINIFIPNTPLHDGAVIMQKDKIAAAACYLPLSESPFISKELGTRHRAALGLSEVTDAITIVVSEETGAISITVNGNLHRNLAIEEFETLLRKAWFGSEQETNQASKWTWRGKRMDKLFNSNWLVRLTALLFAIALFFYVQSENNSTRSTPSAEQADVIEDVKLEVYYDDENLIVTGLPETVNVGIEGPMPIVMREKLAKDYKVFVDLNSLFIGEHRVTIQTENFSEKLEVTVYPQVVNISIEEKVTKEFRVEPEMNSRQINEGYVLKGMTVEPNYVFVTGAKSVMDNINYVKASIKAEDGITESFKQQANVKVLDRDLNKLDVTIQPEAVDINVEIDEYNREIPLTLKQVGQLPEGVTINELSLGQESVKVFGPQSIVDSINEVIAELDLSGLTESGEYEVIIQKPETPMKLSDEKVTVHANITIAEIESEEVTAEDPVTDGDTGEE